MTRGKSRKGPRGQITYNIYDPYQKSNYVFEDASLSTAAHQLGHNISRHRKIIDYPLREFDRIDTAGKARSHLYKALSLFDNYAQQVDAWKIGKYLMRRLTGKYLIGKKISSKQIQRSLDTYRAEKLLAMTRGVYFNENTDFFVNNYRKALHLIKDRKDVTQALSDAYVAQHQGTNIWPFKNEWLNDRVLTWYGRPLTMSRSQLLDAFGYPKVPFHKILK